MRRTILLLAALLQLTLPPVTARGYEPDGGVTFNTPRPWGAPAVRERIVRKVEEAIRHIRPTARDPHPQLILAGYLFDRPESADAVIGACRRGVSVRVIIDRHVRSATLRRIVTVLNADNVRDDDHDGVADDDPRAGRCNRALPADNGGLRHRGIAPMGPRQVTRSLRQPTGSEVTWGRDRSYVLQCSGSCRGAPGGAMHAKIYAFSSVGTADDVVMLSSSNLNAGGVNAGWNDLVVLKDRPKTFSFVADMHLLMTRQRPAGRHLLEAVDGPYRTRLFPVRVGRRRDPLMVDLRAVRCSSEFGPTQLWIQQFWWDGPRGVYLWEKIHGLARAGCKVHIVVGAVDRGIMARMRAARRAGLVDLWDSRHDLDDDGEVNVRTHMKALAIRGTYGTDRRYAGVWTGSANWTDGALRRGDEMTVNIRSAALYRRYVEQWHVVRRHSRRR